MRGLGLVALSLGCWLGSLGALFRWDGLEGAKEYMSIPPAETVRVLGAGFENISADALYVNFIVYFGKHLRKDKAYYNLAPVLDLITDLDPHFQGAYLMGAMALGDNGDVAASEALWDKGVRLNPDNPDFAYNAGMNLFLFATKPDQYERAGKLFAYCSKLKGAPIVARFMEGRCYDVGQRRDLAIKVWSDTYVHASSAEERAVAERTLKRMGAPIPVVPR